MLDNNLEDNYEVFKTGYIIKSILIVALIKYSLIARNEN